MKKRSLSMFLALVFALSINIPTLAFAASATAITSARFEGLTRIVVELDGEAGTITKDQITVFASDFSYTIPSGSIKSVTASGSQVIVNLPNDAFLGKNASIAQVIINGLNGSKNIQMQGTAISSITSRINNTGSTGTSLWHNLGTSVPYRQASVGDAGQSYSMVGAKVNVLLIVFDFPDAKAEDNNGFVGLPGDPLIDRHNYVNGHRLRTADDYFEWLKDRNIEFMDIASYGNVKMTFELLKNSRSEDGIYRMPYTLYPTSYYLPGGYVYEADKAAGKPTDYPFIANNPNNWAGYAFPRGGSTSNWNSASVGYPSVSGLRADFQAQFGSFPTSYFTMGYIAAVENGPGISYGQSFSSGGNLATALGISSLKNYSFMGGDSYSSFKYKHLTHELGHQMGLIDYYINSYNGYGSGQCDPYVGTADYYSSIAGYDFMGYITGIAPDYLAWIKWKFGWVRDQQVVAITQDGTYTVELTPIEVDGGSKLIFIPGERAGVVYCIEYRQKLGVDNIEKLEKSTDPYDPEGNNPEALWDHDTTAYGTDTKPGILMYRLDANQASLSGGLVVIDILDRDLNYDDYDKRFSVTLNNSLLGPTSGIYSYTNDSWGITVSVDPSQTLELGSDAPYAVTVTKTTPTTAGRAAVLLEAEFVNATTIQVKTGTDLRGLITSNINVTRTNGATVSVGINQMTSASFRVTVPAGSFTMDDVRNGGGTIRVSGTTGMSNYTASTAIPIKAAPAGVITEATLTQAQFQSLTTIAAYSENDLTGIAAANLVITKGNGSVVPTNQITGVVYNKTSKLLTITLNASQFPDRASTKNTTLTITPFSNYQPAVLNLSHAKYYHDVKIFETTTPITLSTSMIQGLMIKTDQSLIKKGDYVTLDTGFAEKVDSNAARLTYTYDASKFTFANFMPADGITVLDRIIDDENGTVTLVLMINDYNTLNYGGVMLQAKADAVLENSVTAVSVWAEYVVRGDTEKEIVTAFASTSFTTLATIPGDTTGDGTCTLIDLSNVIDYFGIDSTHSEWESKYRFFDYLNVGVIDIRNIVYVAQRIQ